MPRSEIIAQFSYILKTIIRIIKRYDSEHLFYPKHYNIGCPKSLTEKDSLQAELALKRGLVSTAIELRDQFFSNVSASTVRRMLNSRGYRAYRRRKVIYLTSEQKRKRKIWAKFMGGWTQRMWNKVVFSDESKFNVFGLDDCFKVWRKKGEGEYKETNTYKTV